MTDHTWWTDEDRIALADHLDREADRWSVKLLRPAHAQWLRCCADLLRAAAGH